jgi:GTP cyclohydrolase II
MPLASITKVADADFPTRWGKFRILGFEGLTLPGDPARKSVESAIALVMGDVKALATDGGSVSPIVRIHSQCLTGDVFHSLRCDCHDQLHLALTRIADEGCGILIYEQQEGRGIGLMAKLRAYELQDSGADTVEANEQLGYEADYRHFELPAEILKSLGVTSVRLITNNPDKVSALEDVGITVTERLSAAIPTEPTFERYLQTKHEKMGHLVG